MFSSRTGQWLSEDPSEFFADDPNLKRYCGNSPTDTTDPTGLFGSWGGAGMVTKDGKLINPFSGKTVPPTTPPPIVGPTPILNFLKYTKPHYMPGGIPVAETRSNHKWIDLPNDVPGPIVNSLWYKETVHAVLIEMGYLGDVAYPWTHNLALNVELSQLMLKAPELCTLEHFDARFASADPNSAFYEQLKTLRKFVENYHNGIDSSWSFSPKPIPGNGMILTISSSLESKDGDPFKKGTITGGPTLQLEFK